MFHSNVSFKQTCTQVLKASRKQEVCLVTCKRSVNYRKTKQTGLKRQFQSPPGSCLARLLHYFKFLTLILTVACFQEAILVLAHLKRELNTVHCKHFKFFEPFFIHTSFAPE